MKNVRSGLDALLVATRVSKALTDVSVYMCVVKGTVGRPVTTTIGGYIENILRQQCGSWSVVLWRTEVCRRPHSIAWSAVLTRLRLWQEESMCVRFLITVRPDHVALLPCRGVRSTPDRSVSSRRAGLGEDAPVRAGARLGAGATGPDAV